jgi:O-antigen ligase
MSATWALDRTVTFAALGTLVQLFLIAVLVADAVVRRPTMIRPLLWAYSISAALVAVYATVQYFSGGISGDRVAAFADQDVAQFAAILLPAIVFATFELLAGRRAVLSAGVAGICMIAVLLSGTRGAWLGLAVVFLLFVVPRLWTVVSSGGAPRVIAVVLGGIVAIGIVSQIPGVADQIIRRADLAVPTGGAGRTDIWTVGLNIYGTSPVVGVGYGNFPVAFTPELVRESSDIADDVGSARGPHSIIVGTLGELGIVGLVLLGAFILPLVGRRGWGPDAGVVQATLVTLMTAALFLDVLNRKQVWLVIGIAGGLAFMDRVRRRNESHGVLIAAPGREDGAPRDGT